MSSKHRRPPYDPDIAAALAGRPFFSLTRARIPERRKPEFLTPEDLSIFDVERRDILVPGFEGAELELAIFTPRGHTGVGPGIFSIHGGGMVLGDPGAGISLVLPWVVEHGAVAASVGYRLAPEHPDPYPVEDCYSALEWVSEHAADIGIDRDRIMISGASAGGGLAAGTALLARDRGGPGLIGQMLMCPMLDDREQTVSASQYEGVGVWDRNSNRTGWAALLGDRRGGADVSIYAAPARADDLSGLPPAFIDGGSAEVFRDEIVAYASQIWADGGVAELHIWPGGTHGWEFLAPEGRMALQAAAARQSWVARLFESA